MTRHTQRSSLRALSVLIGASALLMTTGCSLLPLPGVAQNSHCPKPHDLNVAWGNLLIESGIGLTAEDFTSLDSSPYRLGSMNNIDSRELREAIGEACVYVLQQDAPGFEEANGVFIYATDPVDRERIDATLKTTGWRSETTVKSPEQDQSWSHKECGEATEMTRIAQGKPELVGGFVESFSQQLKAALPHTSYALAMNFPSSCS